MADYVADISPEHPALPGHFPGHPIVPGVLVLTAALRAMEEEFGADLRLVGLPTVKFGAPLRPGEPVTVRLGRESEAQRVNFTVLRRNAVIASGTMRYRGTRLGDLDDGEA